MVIGKSMVQGPCVEINNSSRRSRAAMENMSNKGGLKTECWARVW